MTLRKGIGSTQIEDAAWWLASWLLGLIVVPMHGFNVIPRGRDMVEDMRL
jgi:hypothetical protein